MRQENSKKDYIKYGWHKRRKAWFTITIFSTIYDETQNSMIAEEWEIKEKAEEDMIVENVENIFDNMLIKKAYY